MREARQGGGRRRRCPGSELELWELSWHLALAATDCCPCHSLDALTLILVAPCAAATTVRGLCLQRMLLPLVSVSGAARGVDSTGDALGAHVAQHQRCRLAIPLGNIAHGC